VDNRWILQEEPSEQGESKKKSKQARIDQANNATKILLLRGEGIGRWRKACRTRRKAYRRSIG
jgi:hypothetical protein